MSTMLQSSLAGSSVFHSKTMCTLASCLSYILISKVDRHLRSGGGHPSQSNPFRLRRVEKKGILPLLGRTEQRDHE